MRRNAVLLDADVVIDYLRSREQAIAYLEAESRRLHLSTLTVAELYAGVRDGRERRTLDGFLEAFALVPLEPDDAVRGGLHRRDYFRSHGTGLVDACVAAQAERLSAELVTLNGKHFPMLAGDAINVPYRKG